MSISVNTFYEPYYNEKYQILRLEGDNGAFVEYDPYEPFEGILLTDTFQMYETILDYIRLSDRADFWAFFHQCWNLLPLSYHLKLKYPNTILQKYPKPTPIPKLTDLVYTQVLTKQSALFNSWKEMNRMSNEHTIPFRCVSQWATSQTGKLKDTLGLPLLPLLPLQTPNPSTPLVVSPSSVSAPAAQLNAPAPALVHKRVIRKKKSDTLPLTG
jgi:hypothetical protein